MNGGITFVAPSTFATAICGLTAGLLPPTAGAAWQLAQLLLLYLGPRLTPASIVPDTESTSLKRAAAAVQNATSPELSPTSGPPAAGGPPRTPGSYGPLCENAGPTIKKWASNAPATPLVTDLHDLAIFPPYRDVHFRAAT